MKLWKISQDENSGFDTYDSAVVAAETEEEAKKTHPGQSIHWPSEYSHTWASSPEHVQAESIGEAIPGTKAGVILASYNAV